MRSVQRHLCVRLYTFRVVFVDERMAYGTNQIVCNMTQVLPTVVKDIILNPPEDIPFAIGLLWTGDGSLIYRFRIYALASTDRMQGMLVCVYFVVSNETFTRINYTDSFPNDNP